ncbi:MAG: 5' nucleotidase, NT5C type [Candidatus Heimdallarchaeaceae archaeon]
MIKDGPVFFCDLDGVLRNLISGIASVAGVIYTDALYRSVTCWDATLCGKRIFEWVQCPEVFLAAKPYPGAHEFISNLKDKGFVVYILTSQIFRPEILGAQTSWLFAHGFLDLVDGIIMVRDPMEKITFLEGDDHRFLLDDHPKLALEYNFQVDGFLSMERPWNPNGMFREFEEVVNYVEYTIL